MITNLAFEGGGVRGIAYAGVFLCLDKLGLLSRIKRVVGSSAGSLAAFLIGVGYNAKEIQVALLSKNMGDFVDNSYLSSVGNTYSLFNIYGWNDTSALQEWLYVLLRKQNIDENITFKQLNDKGMPELSVVGTNVTKGTTIIFNHMNTPDVKVVVAVTINVTSNVLHRYLFGWRLLCRRRYFQ